MSSNVSTLRNHQPWFLRTSDLHRQGLRHRQVTAAVTSGALVRLRQGAYCLPDTDSQAQAAGRIRGRLACVTELRRQGVFVLEHSFPHIHIDSEAARLRRLDGSTRVHRSRLARKPHPRSLSVEAFDAVREAVLCQTPRATIATLDSALHLGLLRHDELDELFHSLPRRYRRLFALVDARAESGPETFMRLILKSIGCSFEVQVRIDEVGRVDFLVDGWLIIECDSESFHSSWADQKRDRRRDQAAAKRGFTTFRPIAEDIMWHPDVVREAILGLLRARVAV